jgi:hypothetical protein
MNSKNFAAYVIISALAVFLFTQWPADVYVQEHREATNKATLTGGPMVQIGKRDGLTSIVITWRTLEQSNSQVDFGESSSYGQKVIKDKLTDRHAVVLPHLQPNTRYYYQVRSNNIVLASAIFQTGKVGDTPFRFAVFGDSGSGKSQQYEVAREVEEENVDFILHLGDVVYSHGEDKEYLPRMYLPYKNLLARVPFFPTIGNHDIHTANGQPWLANFALPGKERFYSFSYGNAFFISLDSYDIDSRSADWLDRRLGRTDKLWKFVFFHEPPFQIGSGDPETLMPAVSGCPCLKNTKLTLFSRATTICIHALSPRTTWFTSSKASEGGRSDNTIRRQRGFCSPTTASSDLAWLT